MKIYTAEAHIEDGRTVGLSKKLQKKAEDVHRHEFIELVYILSGSARQLVDDATFEVFRGDIVFINYGSRHAFEPITDFEYVNIYFMPELLGETMITQSNALALLSLTAFDEMRRDKNGGKLSFFGEERREIEFIISAMLSEYESNESDASRVIESYLSILFTKMLRKTAFPTAGEKQNVWDELRDYIDANLGDELTLSALAQKSFYNPSYFSRIFKQKFGVSLSDYVRTRRIEQAMQWLSRTELSLNDIISRVGYADRSAFYHAFAKHTGMTPMEYRAQSKVK